MCLHRVTIATVVLQGRGVLSGGRLGRMDAALARACPAGRGLPGGAVDHSGVGAISQHRAVAGAPAGGPALRGWGVLPGGGERRGKGTGRERGRGRGRWRGRERQREKDRPG